MNWFDNQRRKKSRLGKAAGAVPASGTPSLPPEATATGATIDLTEGDDQAMDCDERQERGKPGMGAGGQDGSVALRGGVGDDSPTAEDAMEICGQSPFQHTSQSIYLCKNLSAKDFGTEL